MVNSIGEVFISLGFDVDETKLKSFNDGISRAVHGVASLAGISSVTVAGLGYFASHIADNSLKVKNFADANHLAAEGLLRYQAILKQTTGAGADEAFASYKRLNDYLVSLSNGGYAGVMNQLGARFTVGMTVDQMIESIAEALPAIMATHRYTPQQINALLGQLGFTENAQAWLLLPKSERDALGAKGISGSDNELNARLAIQLKDLTQSWDTFVNHILASVAPEATSILDTFNKKGWWATVEKIGKDDSGWIDWISNKVRGGAQGIANWADDTLHPEDRARAFFRQQGWTAAQAQGIVARLLKESGLDIDAVGDHGAAYGIAQWHPDRQANFAKWAGHSIRGSTLEEQLAYIQYELTKGLEQRAGRALRRTTTQDEAETSYTRNYERPASNNNITMYINSQAPAKDVADQVTNNLQRQINTDFVTRNRGPVQ